MLLWPFSSTSPRPSSGGWLCVLRPLTGPTPQYNLVCGDANKLVQSGHAIDPECVGVLTYTLTLQAAPRPRARACQPSRARLAGGDHRTSLSRSSLTLQGQMVKRLTTGNGHETRIDSDKRS